MGRDQLEDRTSLSRIRRSIRADLNAAGVEPAIAFDCLVAVTEACTNALVHGHCAGGGGTPEVTWDVEGAVARFRIRDYSTRGWSKAAHPSRDPELERARGNPLGDRVGGFGIELMQGLMDEVDIAARADGTVVTMLKRLRAGPRDRDAARRH
ncbi:MAG TPA: ATP-binding protein [Actinomycetota bacterium]|nr:ATP-binding protein [Actinomycetota bacterium]